MMDIIVDIFSIITLSGFSRFAESAAGRLEFTKAFASVNIAEVIALIVMLVLLIRPRTIIISFRDLARSFTKKIYPNAVVTLKYKGNVLSQENIDQHTLSFLSTIGIQLILSFILSFEAASFSDALLLSTAILGNSGWILLLIGKTSLLAGFSVWMKLFVCLMLLPRKIKYIYQLLKKNKQKKQNK